MNNEFSSSLVLLFILLSPVYLASEYLSVALAVLCLFYIVFSSAILPRAALYFVLPVVLLALSGLHGVFSNPSIDVVRDAWYILKCIPGIFIGILLAQKMRIGTVYRVIVMAGVVSAAVHIFGVLYYGVFFASLKDIRGTVGAGYLISVIALVFVFATYRFSIKLTRRWKFLGMFAALLLILSLYLSFSRTWLGVFIILIFVIFGVWGNRDWKSIVITLCGVFAIWFVFLGYEAVGGRDVTFVDKLLGSIDEMKVSDYSSDAEINSHWRGFEAKKFMDTYLEGNVYEKIFGFGLGALADLGYERYLGGMATTVRYITISHNVFPTVLLKSGLVGLGLYLYFCWSIMRSGFRLDRDKRLTSMLTSRFLISFGWILLMTSFLISGLYNKTAISPLITVLGVFWYYEYSQKILKQKQKVLS